VALPRKAYTSFNSNSASSPTQAPECLTSAFAEERCGTSLLPALTLLRRDCFFASKRSSTGVQSAAQAALPGQRPSPPVQGADDLAGTGRADENVATFRISLEWIARLTSHIPDRQCLACGPPEIVGASHPACLRGRPPPVLLRQDRPGHRITTAGQWGRILLVRQQKRNFL
jgi:hypothetical protein